MFLNRDKTIDPHRGNLPHWQQGETWIFVTWRLADSLPLAIVNKLAAQRTEWEKRHPKPWSDINLREYHRKFTLRLETLLDNAHGECLLAKQELRECVSAAMMHFHHDRYELDCFVIMPNQVHVLFRPLKEHRLEVILQSLKRHSSREINKLRKTEGKIWQREYWDRLIRSEKHFQWTREYIANNPQHLAPGSFTLWSRNS